jgi:hypothetical protein
MKSTYSTLPRTTTLALACLSLGWMAGGHVCAQDHGHLRIAALSTNHGSALYFYNGADFARTSSYVKTLVFTNSGTYAGYFQQNITFTVQAATAAFSGPEPDAPAFGAYIRARMLSVQGPAGGMFSFWNTGATNPTISLLCGETGTNSYNVTQTDGSPTADPYGHVHGRKFTATKPGIYTVAFQAYDDSTNGPAGGPIHTPSGVIEVRFQAGVNIESVEPDFEDGHVHVRFGATAGFMWQVEYSRQLGPQAEWFPVENPVSGNDYFFEKTHELSPGTQRFYRVIGIPVTPP